MLEGIGLGLRQPIANDLFAMAPPSLKWLELHPENYLARGGRYATLLARARERFPLLTHGLSMGFGSLTPFDAESLRGLRALVRELGCPWHSDHLCFSSVDGVYLHDLLPLPRNEESIRLAVARVREAQDALGVPIAIEHISYYATPPGSDLDEVDHLCAILEGADARLLLDVNNVFVNALNHGFDPYVFIDRLPLERVVQLHVAGHHVRADGLRIDTHAEPVCEEVFALFEYTMNKLRRPLPVLLERDEQFPEFGALAAEVERLDGIYRSVLARVARETASASTACARGAPFDAHTDAPSSFRKRAEEPPASTSSQARGRTARFDRLRARECASTGAASLNLSAYQRAVVELGFAAREHPDPALAPFALYRHMIRSRLLAMAAVAYRRSWALLGDAACTASFARFLARTPPQSPLIREVIGAFARFAADDAALFVGAPAHARDLLSFEAAKWRVASAPAESSVGTLREVDFDGVLAVNPTLERVVLDHLVSEDGEPLCPRDSHTLLVYRRRDLDDVRWYRAPGLLADLLALSCEQAFRQATLGTSVAALFARRAPPPDRVEELLEALAGALTVAVERDVLWGVHDPLPA